MEKLKQSLKKTLPLLLLCWMFSAPIISQEIEKEFYQRLEEVKTTHGVTATNDSVDIVVVNTKMIEKFYNNYENIEHFSIIDLIKDKKFDEAKDYFVAYQQVQFNDYDTENLANAIEQTYTKIKEDTNLQIRISKQFADNQDSTGIVIVKD